MPKGEAANVGVRKAIAETQRQAAQVCRIIVPCSHKLECTRVYLYSYLIAFRMNVALTTGIVNVDFYLKQGWG